MNNLLEHELLSIPHYLPLRNYGYEDNYHILDIGADKDFKRMRLDDLSFEVLKSFTSPSKPKDVSNKTGASLNDVLQFCNSLKKDGLLKKHQDVSDQFDRYSRHLQYYGLSDIDPNEAQKKLSNLRITLVGVGGIGNWVGLNLVGLGIKKLKLIDPDTIEDSNLPRQVLFDEDDLGKFKVDIAERELKKRNRNLEVESIKQQVSSENILDLISDSDFVVLSADKPFFLIQKWTNEACLKLGIPLLNVGYAGQEGVMGPLVVPGKSACLACNNNINTNKSYLQNKDKVDLFNSRFIAPSFVCLNSLISSMASYEIVKFFLGFGELSSLDNMVRINPLNFSINKIENKRDSECLACNQLK